MAKAKSRPVAANDNNPDLEDYAKGEHILPALLRAVRDDLMLPDEDNERATIALGRIYRVFHCEPVNDNVALPGRPKRVSNRERQEPIYNETPAIWPRDTRLRDMIEFADDDDPERDEKDRATIAGLAMRVVKRDWRDPTTGVVSTVYVGQYLKDGEWLEYGDYWGDVRKAEGHFDGYRLRNARVTASRMDLADMDEIDRNLFRDLMGEEHMATAELFIAGAKMAEIGAAAGYKGKQAEAVGLDRIRTMVRRAQRVFADIAKARKCSYPWQVDPAIAMHFPTKKRAA